MENFEHHIPTKLYFGKGSISYLAESLNEYGKRVLLTYGGGSIKKIGLYDEVKDYVEYNANRALANLGYPGYFEDKDINPIIENAMNTSTKNHDFFSVKGDGYVVSMNVESIEDEDFIFE